MEEEREGRVVEWTGVTDDGDKKDTPNQSSVKQAHVITKWST